jgi:hypothetical protein
MRLSGANIRGGRGYNEMMARLLHNHGLGDSKWKQTRAALLNIHEHRGDVDAMRSRWDHDQLLKRQAPTTVWDKFNKREKSDDPRPRGKSTSATNRSQILIELQEENGRLKQEIARLKAQLRNPFDGLDAAEMVTLLVEQCDQDMREAITAGLTESQRIPPGTTTKRNDNWPVEERPHRAEATEDSPLVKKQIASLACGESWYGYEDDPCPHCGFGGEEDDEAGSEEETER